MAINAVRWRVGVLTVAMTVRARRRLMCTGKRETRCAVIERRRSPGNVVVTCLALLREITLNVIGVLRGCKIVAMARHTFDRLSHVHIIRMTCVAILNSVRARHREAALVMNKSGCAPLRWRVARLAIGRKSRRSVIRIGCRRETPLMARHAMRRC